MTREPRFPQGVPIPMTPISPGDLAVIAEIVNSYLTYIRLAFRASATRDMYVRYIEDLRRRLAGQYRENTSLTHPGRHRDDRNCDEYL